MKSVINAGIQATRGIRRSIDPDTLVCAQPLPPNFGADHARLYGAENAENRGITNPVVFQTLN